MSKSKILFQLSGSIACFKSCALISRLVQEKHEVRVACSPAALEFVGKATLEGLSGHPPFVDMFSSGSQMDHISLAAWADLAILCPASANKINQLAAGLSQDTVGALFLAFDLNKPYLVVPAMNEKMYDHPATQAALQKLKSWGVEVVDPASGYLACGDYGKGRLPDPNMIYERILGAL